MKERPILFSGEMVRAILDARKTQTRRVVLKSGVDADYDCLGIENGRAIFHANRPAKRKELLMPCFGVPCRFEAGIKLWVRETFKLWDYSLTELCCEYQADGQDKIYQLAQHETKPANLHSRKLDGSRFWRPSIFMPRWASRITLEVLSVRVERVQDITGSAILNEGACPPQISGGERDTLLNVYWIPLWNSINGKGSWDKNPWVWRIEFKRI